MDRVTRYRHIIQALVTDYATVSISVGDIKNQAVIDSQNDRYFVIMDGWLKEERMYNVIIDIELIDGKVWLQAVNTDRDIAEELVAAGIPRDDIVIGFRHPSVRQYTGYASG